MIRLSFDAAALNAKLADLGSRMAAAARPAAQAGAQVLYEEVRSNVDRIGVVSGNLRRAVYQAYATHDSSPEPGGRKAYHISWNWRKAPHGQLLEYGHLQRYVVFYRGGRWITAVRPSMRGKPRPKRRAPQAVKDAYYVTLPGGPRHVAARPFLRPAAAAMPRALDAARAVFRRQLSGSHRISGS